MAHGRGRLLPSTAVLAAIGVTALTVASCEPDHNRDVPGPPHVISAYVLDPTLPSAVDPTATCDTTDPRVFGGDFQARPPGKDPVPIRCVPDLTRKGADALPVA